MMDFQNKLKILKELNFPTSEFVVVGSGSLAIREIRDTKDLDVIVTQSLWDNFSKKYKVELNESSIERLDLGNDIEILNPSQSLFGNSKIILVDEIFEKADMFGGVKFINLDHLKKIKFSFGREKDLKDIKLIDEYLLKNNI